MSSSVASAAADDMDDNLTQQQLNQVVNVVSALKQEVNSIANKMGELDVERNEHKSVIDAIGKLDPLRKCYRLVGGVLVERTVEDVLPAVTKNYESISVAIGQLSDNLKKKEATLQELLQKYGRFLSPQSQQPEEQQQDSQTKAGTSILV